MREEVLQYISSIEEAEYTAESAVMASMLDMLDKECIIEAYCEENDTDWYQEAGVLETVKNKSKNDSNSIVTAIKFIPRLLGAILKSITSAIKKSNLGKRCSVLLKKLAGMSDAEAKQSYCDKINASNGGEFTAYVDKNGEIKFKRGATKVVADVLELGAVAMSIPSFLAALNTFNKNKNPDLAELEKASKNCAAFGSFNSTNDRLKKKDLSVTELNQFLSAASAIDVTLKGAIDLFNAKMGSSICKDYIKGLEGSKKTKYKEQAVHIGQALSAVGSVIAVGLTGAKSIIAISEKFITKPVRESSKRNELDRSMKLIRACLKKPGDMNNRKEGMNRGDLEKVYPIGKNESATAYADRIDSITHDIADVYRMIIDKASNKKTVDESVDKVKMLINGKIPPECNIDDKILKYMRLPAIDADGNINYNIPMWNPFSAAINESTFYDVVYYILVGKYHNPATGGYSNEPVKTILSASKNVRNDRANKIAGNITDEKNALEARRKAAEEDQKARYNK